MKHKVGVRAMPDQTTREFKAIPYKPRTKVFTDKDRAYDYLAVLKSLAKRNCFEAYLFEYQRPREKREASLVVGLS